MTQLGYGACQLQAAGQSGGVTMEAVGGWIIGQGLLLP